MIYLYTEEQFKQNRNTVRLVGAINESCMAVLKRCVQDPEKLAIELWDTEPMRPLIRAGAYSPVTTYQEAKALLESEVPKLLKRLTY